MWLAAPSPQVVVSRWRLAMQGLAGGAVDRRIEAGASI